MKCPHCGGEVSSPVPASRWRVGEDGIIYFSVTSNGMTGEEWIVHLEGKGDNLDQYTKSVLQSEDFEPTNGVTTEVAVLPGSLWKSDDLRTTKNIRIEAKQRKLGKLNAEVACLIRDMFTDEDLEKMGFWWLIVMHAPIDDSVGDPSLLGVHRNGVGRRLYAFYGKPDIRWNRDDGFAFAAPASLPAAGR